MKQEVSPSKTVQYLSYGVAFILILLPFHAFFTTWAGSNFGHIDLFRIWKELLLVPIGLGALYAGIKQPATKRWMQTSSLFYLILGYVLLQILMGVLAMRSHDVNASALIYGLLANSRFLVFFVVCLLLSAQSKWLRRHWRPLLIWPALIAVSFAVLQLIVLPADFLRHFGYGPDTTLAYQMVDLKAQYLRLQSTLRGPNPFGAYLVLVISAFFYQLIKGKRGRNYWAYTLVIAVLVLFFTYSRSAWLGASLAVALLGWRQLDSRVWRTRILAGAGVILILGMAGTLLLRNNDRFQNVFFHTDEHSRSADSSNQDRAGALKSGLEDVWHEPLGRGPGTAGPASVRNDHSPRIAENYFLQVGQEVGILGMGLFIAINILLAVYLWRVRGELSLILLASLAGITLVNLLSHAWTDDTLSLLWWGLAGIAIGAHLPSYSRNSKHR